MGESSGFRILIVNPNSTEGFTTNLEASLEPPPGFKLDFLTAPLHGPSSINSVTSGVLSASACLESVLERFKEAGDRLDGVLVACFSNHVLVPMLREALPTRVPIVGIFDGALIHASQVGGRFGIVTTEPRWEPLLTEDVRKFGFSHRCAGVVSSGLTVLEAERLPKDVVASALAKKASWLVETQGADTIILGCAGFAGLDVAVRAAVGSGVPIVDGVTAGVEVLVGLIRSKLKTSSVGMYAPLKS